ncbi:MAG: class I SAM-dependent methyltransferase [Rhodospirillaceae bacterium]
MFHKDSYERHKNNWKKELTLPDRLKIHETWFREDTVDFYRHLRMYEPVFECLNSKKEKKWLTVGDGRYGLDAIRMKRRGFSDVTSTDITEDLLKLAYDAGYLDKFSAQNAECLTFDDEVFDYVLCKEAFHHFPRPYLALYEMLRVAKEAVVLIEPQDKYIDLPMYQDARKPGYEEEDANFIYDTSQAELEKVCLALNFPCLAVKNISDIYEKGVEFERAIDSNSFFTEFKRKISEREQLCNANKEKHNLLMAVLFKKIPDLLDINVFQEFGWKICDLGNNPYLTKDDKKTANQDEKQTISIEANQDGTARIYSL